MKILRRRSARAHRQLRPGRPAAIWSGRNSSVTCSTARRATRRSAACARPRPGSPWRGRSSHRRRMEQRVLAAAYRTRQLPPLAGDRPRRRAQVSRLFAGRRAGSPGAVAAFAAAASVAAAVALGVTQVSTQHQLESARASDAAISRVVTAPDARIETTRDESGRKRHRRRLRRPAGSRRHRHRDGFPADGAGLPGVGDEPVRRPLGGPDGTGQHPAGFRGGARGPDRDNRRARGRDVEARPPRPSRSCPPSPTAVRADLAGVVQQALEPAHVGSGPAAPDGLCIALRYIGLRYSGWRLYGRPPGRALHRSGDPGRWRTPTRVPDGPAADGLARREDTAPVRWPGIWPRRRPASGWMDVASWPPTVSR